MCASIGVALLLASWASWCAPTLRAAPATLRFPLRAHVAPWDTGPSQAFLDAQLAAANLLFSTHDVQFTIHERLPLRGSARLRGFRDVMALQPFVDRSRIDVFVVESIWLERTRQGRTTIGYCSPRVTGLHPVVVISTTAERNTLAHELGHYFGLEHSTTPGNLMWRAVGAGMLLPGALSLDAAQGAVIAEQAGRFARDGQPAPIADH